MGRASDAPARLSSPAGSNAPPCSGVVCRVKRRHVFVIAAARDLRGRAGWRLKNAREEGGQGKLAGRGSFTIALCVYDLARVAGAGKNSGETPRGNRSLARLGLAREIAGREARKFSIFARAAPLIAALAVPGCAPVGPNFERPAAIVSPQFKEIKGWKIATPRANEPKGEWWSVFHDPELDAAYAGRRGVQPDDQGGRGQFPSRPGAHQ